MNKLILTICLLAVLALPGCESTDEGTQLRPDVAETLDNAAVVAEASTPALMAVSVLWPPATAVVSVLSGLLIMWRKLKPQVTKAKDEAEFYGDITEAIVDSIEEWKKVRPDDWEYLEAELVKVIGPKAYTVIGAIKSSRAFASITE